MIRLPNDKGTEILRSEVGSTLHGTGLPGQEDRDEMGVFIPYGPGTDRAVDTPNQATRGTLRTRRSGPHDGGSRRRMPLHPSW